MIGIDSKKIKQKGITLIEALISTAIVGIGFIAVFQMVNYSVTSIDVSGERTKTNYLSSMIAEDLIGDRFTEIKVGGTDKKIIMRHILPNVFSPIMVSATLGIANAIITESALSFLGLGFPPDFPTWGRLLNDAVEFIQLHPERVFWPGLAISLTVLSINYLGDGLRDAPDPRIRGR